MMADGDEVFAGRVAALEALARRGEWALVAELLGRLDADVRDAVVAALLERGVDVPCAEVRS